MIFRFCIDKFMVLFRFVLQGCQNICDKNSNLKIFVLFGNINWQAVSYHQPAESIAESIQGNSCV